MKNPIFQAGFNQKRLTGLTNSWLRALGLGLLAVLIISHFQEMPGSVVFVAAGFAAVISLFLLYKKRVFLAGNFSIKLTDQFLEIPRLIGRPNKIKLTDIKSVESLWVLQKEVGILIGCKNYKQTVIESNVFLSLDEFYLLKETLKGLLKNNTKAFFVENKNACSTIANGSTYPVAILAAIFAACYLWSSSSDGFWHISDVAIELVGNKRGLFVSGEYYRLFTAFFFHITLLHLMVNILVLGQFGQILNRILGVSQFLAVVFLSALIGAIASNLISGYEYSIGASGGLYGIIGGFVYLKIRFYEKLPSSVNPMSTTFLLGLIVLDMVLGLYYYESVDVVNHAFGLITGFVVCAVMNFNSITPGKFEAVNKLVSVVISSAFVLAMGSAFWSYYLLP